MNWKASCADLPGKVPGPACDPKNQPDAEVPLHGASAQVSVIMAVQ